jgi:3-deoxy-D-manno-octulosonic-acid transferase
MLWQRLRRGKEIAGRLHERRGIESSPRPTGQLLWLHAASVGEMVSVLPVLAALLARAPALTVLLTTGTATSARLLAQRLTADQRRRIIHRFVPLDVPAWVGRFLDHWQPDAAGFLESELWPNLLLAARRRSVPMVLLNARISSRSLAGWRRMPGLARQVLGCFMAIQAQSEMYAARLRSLGGRNVTAPGNLKFAAPPLPVDAAALSCFAPILGTRHVWLAASTHPGEEALIFRVHHLLAHAHPGLLTILVPRHPERGAEIAAQAGEILVARRARGETPPAQGVWLADTLGELGLWYRLARIVFVGRSLLPPGGGQNPLEPARLGCAVAVGPYTANFVDAVAVLREAGALTVIRDVQTLAQWVAALLATPTRLTEMGAAGAMAAARYADLPERTADALLALMPA